MQWAHMVRSGQFRSHDMVDGSFTGEPNGLHHCFLVDDNSSDSETAVIVIMAMSWL